MTSSNMTLQAAGLTIDCLCYIDLLVVVGRVTVVLQHCSFTIIEQIGVNSLKSIGLKRNLIMCHGLVVKALYLEPISPWFESDKNHWQRQEALSAIIGLGSNRKPLQDKVLLCHLNLNYSCDSKVSVKIFNAIMLYLNLHIIWVINSLSNCHV